MGNESRQLDLISALKNSSQYDMKKADIVRKIRNYLVTNGLQTSNFGKKYLERLESIGNGTDYSTCKCLLCQGESADGIFCGDCMVKYSGGRLKIFAADENASDIETLTNIEAAFGLGEEASNEAAFGLGEEAANEAAFGLGEEAANEVAFGLGEEAANEAVFEPGLEVNIGEEPENASEDDLKLREELAKELGLKTDFGEAAIIQFCEECGYELGNSDICIRCNTPRGMGTKFCSCCGAPVRGGRYVKGFRWKGSRERQKFDSIKLLKEVEDKAQAKLSAIENSSIFARAVDLLRRNIRVTLIACFALIILLVGIGLLASGRKTGPFAVLDMTQKQVERKFGEGQMVNDNSYYFDNGYYIWFENGKALELSYQEPSIKLYGAGVGDDTAVLANQLTDHGFECVSAREASGTYIYTYSSSNYAVRFWANTGRIVSVEVMKNNN